MCGHCGGLLEKAILPFAFSFAGWLIHKSREPKIKKSLKRGFVIVFLSFFLIGCQPKVELTSRECLFYKPISDYSELDTETMSTKLLEIKTRLELEAFENECNARQFCSIHPRFGQCNLATIKK